MITQAQIDQGIKDGIYKLVTRFTVCVDGLPENLDYVTGFRQFRRHYHDYGEAITSAIRAERLIRRFYPNATTYVNHIFYATDDF